jgi:TonB family protein
VIDRVAARKSYQILGITPIDLEKQEALLRIGRTNGAAAIVSAVVSVSDASETVSISIREISEGRDLYHTQYQQRRNAASDDSFPSPSDPSGLFFNFPGIGGITVPKCVSCPNPEYSEEARRSKLSGVVLLSAVFTSQGTVEQVRVTRGVESSVDQAALNAVKRWRVNPAKDSSGAAVSVRVVVEVKFAIK